MFDPSQNHWMQEPQPLRKPSIGDRIEAALSTPLMEGLLIVFAVLVVGTLIAALIP